MTFLTQIRLRRADVPQGRRGRYFLF
jgi:hypothetical protein